MTRWILASLLAVAGLTLIGVVVYVASHLLFDDSEAARHPARDPSIGRDQWAAHQQERLRRQQEFTARARGADVDVSRKAHPQPPPVSRREEERRASARLSKGW